MNKVCNFCNLDKPFTEFYKKIQVKSGLTGECKKCIRSKVLLAHNKNRDHNIVRMADYRQRNLAKLQCYDRSRYASNPEGRLATVNNWRRKNPSKVKESIRRWQQNNKEQKRILVESRSTRFKQSIPKWLTADQRQEIKRIYSDRPEGYHVDHIVPLKGKDVCGLHVPWNLQYLPAHVNLSKGAKHE